VTIEGTAARSARLELLDGGVVTATIRADANGRFERVLRLQRGRHEIRVRCGSGEAAVHVEIGDYAAPPSPATYELLQTGDVILAHDRNSQQDVLYQPVYTHAGLYIGPDADGAPLLVEAAPEETAVDHGPVAAVPIEETLTRRDADRVDVFRLAGGLAGEDRARIVTWARQTAARGLPFRDAAFGDLYRAWLLWDQKHDRPRDAAEFDLLLQELRRHLQATDAFDCATLVWHAYLDNTAAHIDLASPNRVQWGGAAQQESKRLAELLHPLVILPDSFALSGKLRRVTAE
jgi:hypothetical protein